MRARRRSTGLARTGSLCAHPPHAEPVDGRADGPAPRRGPVNGHRRGPA